MANPPKGIVSDDTIADKIEEWYEDENRKDEYNREQAMDAIATAHARVAEEKPKITHDPNKYGFHLVRFIRQELGLKP